MAKGRMGNNNNTISSSITSIEQKAHKLYIRYLFTKKRSPSVIRKDLFNLGLSSPTMASLEKYFNAIIKPLIQKHHLGHIYQDYINVLSQPTDKRRRFPEKLSFRLTMSGKESIDDQINFLKFINELEVDMMWQSELYSYYGAREKVPTDPDTGKILIKSFQSRARMPWCIVHSPHRYLIDEMILEGVADSRIIEVMSRKYGERILAYDVSMYKTCFFSVQMLDTKEQLRSLEIELENVLNHIKNMDVKIRRAGSDGDMNTDVPELLSEKKMLLGRAEELRGSVRALNANFSDAAAGQKAASADVYSMMFKEMMDKTFAKFQLMSKHNDREVVDPMYKLTRMMGTSFELYQKAKDMESSHSDGAQAELLRMVTEQQEKELEERDFDSTLREESAVESENLMPKDSPVDIKDVMGVEELYEGAEDDDEN